MKRDLFIIFFVPLLLNFNCADTDKENVSVQLNFNEQKQAADNLVKDSNKPDNLPFSEFLKKTDEIMEEVFAHPNLSVYFKKLNKKKAKKLIRHVLMTYEGVFNKNWDIMRTVAEELKEEHYFINVFADFKNKFESVITYFRNPNSDPGSFIKSKEGKRLVMFIYVSAKMHGRKDIYEKIENDKFLGGYETYEEFMDKSIDFDSVKAMSESEVKKIFTDKIKEDLEKGESEDKAIVIKLVFRLSEKS
jgi:hypothetical protein